MGKGSDRERRAALEKDLKGIYRSVEARAVPSRLTSLVEQLDDSTRAPAQKRQAGG